MAWFYLVIALTAGAGLSVQAAVNSRLAAGVGGQPLIAAMISFAVGTVCLLVLALLQSNWQTVGAGIGQQPWWRWVGGVIGAGFVFTSVFLAPKIGIGNTMFLFILGQLASSMLIDQYGLIQMPVRPVYWWTLAGRALMLCGVALFVFGERWFKA